MSWQSIAVGGAIFLLGLSAILYMLDRWSVFEDSDANTDTGEDLETLEAQMVDHSVPVLKKHKQLTMPGKVAVLGAVIFSIMVVVYAYLWFKTGTPVDVPHANAMVGGGVAIGAAWFGYVRSNKRDKQRGRLDVLYDDIERADSEREATDTVWFDPGEADTTRKGKMVVYERFESRILGYFERRKLVAHDRDLRDSSHLPGDKVSHVIPDRAWKVGPNHYVLMAGDDKISKDPARKGIYRYSTPDQMSSQQRERLREWARKLEIRIDRKNAVMAELEDEIERLRRKVKTELNNDRKQILEELDQLAQLITYQGNQHQIRVDKGAQRHPESQSEVSEARQNGSSEGAKP